MPEDKVVQHSLCFPVIWPALTRLQVKFKLCILPQSVMPTALMMLLTSFQQLEQQGVETCEKQNIS